MANLIMIPRIIRGELFYQVAGVLFPSRTAAMCAASALLEQQLVGVVVAQGGVQ
jgi:hypothetical protein